MVQKKLNLIHLLPSPRATLAQPPLTRLEALSVCRNLIAKPTLASWQNTTRSGLRFVVETTCRVLSFVVEADALRLAQLIVYALPIRFTNLGDIKAWSENPQGPEFELATSRTCDRPCRAS
jgi:hypothetical protein